MSALKCKLSSESQRGKEQRVRQDKREGTLVRKIVLGGSGEWVCKHRQRHPSETKTLHLLPVNASQFCSYSAPKLKTVLFDGS